MKTAEGSAANAAQPTGYIPGTPFGVRKLTFKMEEIFASGRLTDV
jgi:hypothetical protein